MPWHVVVKQQVLMFGLPTDIAVLHGIAQLWHMQATQWPLSFLCFWMRLHVFKHCTLNCNRSRRGGVLLWIPCKAWPCTSFDFVWKSLPITEVSCISLYSQPMSYRGSVCTTQAQSQAAQGTPCSGTALILYQVTETAHYTHMYLPKNNIHYNENIMFWRKWIITQ